MVRTKFRYGSLVWAHSVKSDAIKKKIRRLNRAGMNMYATVHRSTPTRGMELITDTFPLELYIRKEAVSSYVRLQQVLTLRWEGFHRHTPHIKLHLLSLKESAEELGIHQLMLDIDACDLPRPESTYLVDVTSFQDRGKYKEYMKSICRIFTDGSKHDNRVGSAFALYVGSERIRTGSFRLPDTSSVYQAEIHAIQSAAMYISTNQVQWPVFFFVDSQAALKALNSETISSRVVLNTVRLLNTIPCSVTLVWVPAHSNVVENEFVDGLAKAATEADVIDVIPIPRVAIKNMILSKLRDIWNTNWSEYEDGRMMKYFFPRNDKLKAREIIKLLHLGLGRFIRIISGHNNSRYYQFRLDNTVSPLCRFCANDMETFHHFVFQRPALFFSRQQIFLDQLPDQDINWSVSKILAFSYLDHINRLLDPNSVHDIVLCDSSSESESGSDPDDPN